VQRWSPCTMFLRAAACSTRLRGALVISDAQLPLRRARPRYARGGGGCCVKWLRWPCAASLRAICQLGVSLVLDGSCGGSSGATCDARSRCSALRSDMGGFMRPTHYECEASHCNPDQELSRGSPAPALRRPATRSPPSMQRAQTRPLASCARVPARARNVAARAKAPPEVKDRRVSAGSAGVQRRLMLLWYPGSRSMPARDAQRACAGRAASVDVRRTTASARLLAPSAPLKRPGCLRGRGRGGEPRASAPPRLARSEPRGTACTQGCHGATT